MEFQGALVAPRFQIHYWFQEHFSSNNKICLVCHTLHFTCPYIDLCFANMVAEGSCTWMSHWLGLDADALHVLAGAPYGWNKVPSLTANSRLSRLEFPTSSQEDWSMLSLKYMTGRFITCSGSWVRDIIQFFFQQPWVHLIYKMCFHDWICFPSYMIYCCL